MTDQQLNAANLMVLVIDLTDSCDIQHWITNIRGRCKDLEIVIFANKSDRPRRIHANEVLNHGVRVFLTSIYQVGTVNNAFDDVLSKLVCNDQEKCNLSFDSCTGCHIF